MPLRHTIYAGLAATERTGTDLEAPAFVLLHGLTFDRRMWDPVLDALPPRHRAVAFDLPGHGGSRPLDARGLAPIVTAVRAAVAAAGIVAPIVVGHSIGGPIATIYASANPAAGVVSIEAPIRMEPFAGMLRAIAPELSGPGFGEVWSQLRAGWGMDDVPAPYRALLRPADRAVQDVVLRYQADLLERPLDEVLRWRDDGIAALAAAGVPYVCLLAHHPDPADVAWLAKRLPQADVVVWPVGHHFPHLADPALFTGLLMEIAPRTAVVTPPGV